MDAQTSKKNWNAILPIGSLMIAAISFFIWFLLNWDYFPEWIPFSTSSPVFVITNFFTVIILLVCGLPTALLFIPVLFAELFLSIRFILSKQYLQSMSLITGILILTISTFPWLFREQIDDRLIDYALKRYTPLLEAIEKYKFQTGDYPTSLDTLVPKYLPSVPAIYMKFGEELIYEPLPPTEFPDAPFTLQIKGSSGGSFSGQRFMYCPLTSTSCQEASYKSIVSRSSITRINDWWIWIYSPW